MKNQSLTLTIELLSSAVGFGLLWYATNWMVVLGVFLVLLGNNLMKSRQLAKVLVPLIETIKLINKQPNK